MKTLLDASVIIRYLIGDVPHLADWCAQLIDGGENLTVTEGVLIETAYVLTKHYSVPRGATVDMMIEFLCKSNIDVASLKKPVVIEALLMCRPSGRVSFGDALLWAHSRTDNVAVGTLDRRFPERGITTVRPPTISR